LGDGVTVAQQILVLLV